MLRLEKTLAIALQGHKDGIASLERSAARAEAVAQFIEKIGPDIRAMFQTAADRIDVKQIAQNLTDTVARSTVEPVARTNKELNDTLGTVPSLPREHRAIDENLAESESPRHRSGSLPDFSFALRLPFHLHCLQD